MVGTWKRLATATADGSSKILSTGTITDLPHLRIECFGHVSSGNMDNAGLTFNSDTDNNYARRWNFNSGTDSTTSTGQSHIRFSQGSSSGGGIYASGDIGNKPSNEKILMADVVKNPSTGNDSVPSRSELIGKWAETSENITSIQLRHDGSSNWSTNSYITVWGATDDIVSDEKETLADATVTTSPTPTPTSSGGTLNLTNGGSTVLTTIPLGFTASNTWVLRYKANFGTWSTNSYFHICLSDNDNPITSSQDELGVLYRNDSSSNNFGVHTVAGANPNSVNSQDQQTWSTSTSTDYYFEIVRESSTTAKIKFYGTDSTYGTVSATSSYASVSSDCDGLVKIKIMANNATNTTGAVTISDIKFYNGITAVTSTTTSLAPPANTRYEETDTRKIYRFVDTTPVLWSATNQTWTQTGSNIALSGSTFTGTNVYDNANPADRVVSNEQTALSTDWVCDFEYQTSSSSMNMFPLIIGNTNAVLTANDFDRVHLQTSGNSSTFLRLKGMVSGSSLNGDNWIVGVSGTQYYGRIVKNALVVTLKIYGSSSDRENGTNQVSNTSTITFSSTPADFKFYQVSGRGDGGGGQTSWVTKNVKIYDGVTSPKLWKERNTA